VREVAFERIRYVVDRWGHSQNLLAIDLLNEPEWDGEIGEVHHAETHLIPRVVQVALGGTPEVGIFGTDYPTADGTAIRDYVHVNDLADAHVRSINALANHGGSIVANLGTGEGHSVRQIVDMVEKVSGRLVRVVEQPRRAGDPPALVADPAKAKEVLGWTAVHSDLETIVSTAWEWMEARSNMQSMAIGASA